MSGWIDRAPATYGRPAMDISSVAKGEGPTVAMGLSQQQVIAAILIELGITSMKLSDASLVKAQKLDIRTEYDKSRLVSLVTVIDTESNEETTMFAGREDITKDVYKVMKDTGLTMHEAAKMVMAINGAGDFLPSNVKTTIKPLCVKEDEPIKDDFGLGALGDLTAPVWEKK